MTSVTSVDGETSDSWDRPGEREKEKGIRRERGMPMRRRVECRMLLARAMPYTLISE